MPFRAPLQLMMSSGFCPRTTKGGSEQSKVALVGHGTAVKPSQGRVGRGSCGVLGRLLFSPRFG
jgi:hypothetical protein